MPHDLVHKIPCDASKMIQLSQKRQEKGLRKMHAKLASLKADSQAGAYTERHCRESELEANYDNNKNFNTVPMCTESAMAVSSAVISLANIKE